MKKNLELLIQTMFGRKDLLQRQWVKKWEAMRNRSLTLETNSSPQVYEIEKWTSFIIEGQGVLTVYSAEFLPRDSKIYANASVNMIN